jgi:hypothetical protein
VHVSSSVTLRANRRPVLARDPHDAAIDAGIQLATGAVIGEEGVQVGQ